MNKEIELLNNKLEAQDKIINNQALEIARLKGKSEILEKNNKLLIQQKQQMYEDLDELSNRIDKAIEHCKSNMFVDSQFIYEQLEILGDKDV